MGTHITIVWADPSREAFKTFVAGYEADGSTILLNLREDMLRPGVEAKGLIFPYHTIQSVEIEEREEKPAEGYREENAFREQPGSAPHIPGGKLP